MIASNETTIVSRLKGYASYGFETVRFATIHRTNHAIWRITKPLLLTAPLMRSVRRSPLTDGLTPRAQVRRWRGRCAPAHRPGANLTSTVLVLPSSH